MIFTNPKNNVILKKNNKGDTRTAKEIPTIEEFEDSNRSHIDDVRNVMDLVGGMIVSKGINHDFTKISYRDQFYHDFCEVLNAKKNGVSKDFTNMKWYKDIHIELEKHHINSKLHDDITLLDVIEMIADCICAGKTRSDDGSFYVPEISDDALRLALNNTIKMIDKHTIVSE